MNMILYSLPHDYNIYSNIWSIFMKEIPQKCLYTFLCDISTKNDVSRIIGKKKHLIIISHRKLRPYNLFVDKQYGIKKVEN